MPAHLLVISNSSKNRDGFNGRQQGRFDMSLWMFSR
jgi:hypothetical protein